MDRVKNALQSCGKLNRLKSLWRDGHTALGAIATIPSVQIVQIMGRAGLDWILIDLEHGAIDAGAASEMIAATSGTPSRAVSPRCSGDALACKTASRHRGTTTCKAAESAVRAVRYPPAGERFWGPFYAAPRWGVSLREYLDCPDGEVLAIGTNEHIDAVKSVGEIAHTPARSPLHCTG